MTTKLVSTLVVISFSVLLSACTKPTLPKPAQTESKTESPSENLNQKSTLKSLLGLGKNLICTYSFTDDDNKFQVKSTTFISGKNFAQESETTNPADKTKTTKTNMISDGDFVYTWSTDQKGSGMKIKLEEPKAEDPKTPKTDVASTKESMDTEYDMQCSSWSVDKTKFTLPTDVKFTDLSELMKNIPTIPAMPQLPQ